MPAFSPLTLEIRALSLMRGDAMLLESLSLSLHAGEALLIKGANGCGKTSLLRAVAGLLTPHSGDIVLRQRDADARGYHLLLEAQEHLHLVDEKKGVNPPLTVKENLKFLATLLGTAPARLEKSVQSAPAATEPEAIQNALEMCQIAHLADRSVQTLSQGQRQRAALARLLLIARPIWLLDEPFNGLDAAGCALFLSLLARHLDENGLILLATHQNFDALVQGLPQSGVLAPKILQLGGHS